MHTHTDLIVVGAGIIGAATAYRAVKHGLTVRVLEASDRPVGASIQNFGHACFTGQADVIQPVAERARQGWLEAAADAGLWAHNPGTVIPATTVTQMQVLREFAEHRGGEQVRLLGVDEIRSALGNPGANVVGGAHLPRDLRVNPREVTPKLAQWLAGAGVEYHWNTRVHTVADGRAATTAGEFSADRIVVCPGHGLADMFPSMARDKGVRTCTLAMSLIEPPAGLGPDFAMLTGTSLARYDGFTAMPSAHALAQELKEAEPELVGCVANLMVTGIPEGLLIGDSHHYAISPEPFIDEKVAALLLGRAAGLLGIDRPVVKQRWLGAYADSEGTNLVLERPDARTTVAVVTSGIGMTLSFGIADLILDGSAAPEF